MKILEIKGLKKNFKDLKAVNKLSLSVEKGDIHGILGPNGAGKSTTMNCILGLVAPDAGEVAFDGGKTLKSWKRNVGYVPQELALYDEMTAEENISFFCSLYGFSSKELKKNVVEALEFTGLTDVRNKKAGTFSGGMKRRLNIACGIAHKPQLVIMDEPTVGIDPQSRNKILENVKQLNKNGTTVIYTTHYMPEVDELCNKITVIDHGQVIADGTKQDIISMLGKEVHLHITFKGEMQRLEALKNELLTVEGISRARVTDDMIRIRHPENVSVLDGIIAKSAEMGFSIVNISTVEPSLDEIFLTLTGKETRDKT